MNVEDVHFVTRNAVTAVDFLLDWLWWMRRREWMWKGEEDTCTVSIRSDKTRGTLVSLALSLPSCETRGLGVKP